MTLASFSASRTVSRAPWYESHNSAGSSPHALGCLRNRLVVAAVGTNSSGFSPLLTCCQNSISCSSNQVISSGSRRTGYTVPTSLPKPGPIRLTNMPSSPAAYIACCTWHSTRGGTSAVHASPHPSVIPLVLASTPHFSPFTVPNSRPSRCAAATPLSPTRNWFSCQPFLFFASASHCQS